jgi:hypothetical protein
MQKNFGGAAAPHQFMVGRPCCAAQISAPKGAIREKLINLTKSNLGRAHR